LAFTNATNSRATSQQARRSPPRQQRFRPLLWIGLIAATAWSCDARHDVEGEDVCAEIGFSISNRVYVCTGDGDAANAAYELFAERYACIAPDDGSLINCAIKVRELSCELTDALGDDYGQWLQQASDSCQMAISKQNGDPLDPKQEVDGGA
jgi:hypothetical protein